MVTKLCGDGQLSGAIRIPDAVAPLTVTVDVRAGRVDCYVDIDAPREGRPATRVKWLVRQLANAPAGVRVEAYVAHARGSSAAGLLGAVRENPEMLVGPEGKDLRNFRVSLSAPMGA